MTGLPAWNTSMVTLLQHNGSKQTQMSVLPLLLWSALLVSPLLSLLLHCQTGDTATSSGRCPFFVPGRHAGLLVLLTTDCHVDVRMHSRVYDHPAVAAIALKLAGVVYAAGCGILCCKQLRVG